MEIVLRELVLRRTITAPRADSERVRRRAITETPRRDAEVVIAPRSTSPARPRAAAASVA
jgi:hypothetical protein